MFDSKMTVSELITAHPETIDVFIKRKMLCVGCPTEAFHTLADVARIYGIPLEELIKEFSEIINIPQNHERFQEAVSRGPGKRDAIAAPDAFQSQMKRS